MFRGQEIQPIIKKIFGEVRNYLTGEQVQVNCPKCQEEEGLAYPDDKFNLEINTTKRVFRCWKCDEPKFSGSLGRLIKTYGSNVDYALYKDYIGQFTNMVYSPDEDEDEQQFVVLPEEMILFSKMDTSNHEHLKAYTYLIVDRKLTNEQILKYRLGFCLTGKYAGRIIIPSYDNEGKLIYFVSRAFWSGLKPPYLNPKVDKDKIIFNEGYINWDSTVYLVEGVFDMFTLVNAVPQLGKTISKKMFYKLKEKKPNIVIALDPDAKKNAIEMFQKLSAIYVGEEEKIKFLNITGKYDIDEIRRYLGKSEIISKLYDAGKLEVEDYFMLKRGKSYGKNGKRRISYK